MKTMTFDIPDSSPCMDCRKEVLVSELVCSNCGSKASDRFTEIEMYRDFRANYILDVRQGGLVLGRDTDDDDIPVFSSPVEGIFQLTGMMQGWEFVMNSQAFAKNERRVHEINDDKDVEAYKPTMTVEVTDATRIYNTNALHAEMHVLMGNAQFVVNRLSTQKHYKELEQLNNSVALPRPT